MSEICVTSIANVFFRTTRLANACDHLAVKVSWFFGNVKTILGNRLMKTLIRELPKRKSSTVSIGLVIASLI